MAHVRILIIGLVVFLASVTNRVVNALPGHFIVIGRIAEQIGFTVAADHVDAPFSVKRDFGFALLAFLGRYHHDAVGAARTPQGGRSGIFQYRDRFHIPRVHHGQGIGVRVRYPVDYDQRIGVVLAGCANTTNTDTHVDTGLTVDRRYLQAGDGSL